MKLLAIVIAYNPDYDDLRSNIYSYCYDVDHLVVWNNTPYLSNDECKRLLSLDDNIINVEIRGDGQNHLIAYPINQTIRWGLENKFSHILTMDQDSHFEIGAMRKYKEFVTTSNTEIFGPNKRVNNIIGRQGSNPVLVDWVITSGAIYRLSIFEKIGLFREDYGIDAVDFEICFRALSAGYTVLLLPNIILNHALGYPKKSVFGYISRNYSPFRLYYIIRNNIWMQREYPLLRKKNFDSWQVRFFKIFIKIILSESNKIKKIKAMFSGLSDGLFNNKRIAK